MVDRSTLTDWLYPSTVSLTRNVVLGARSVRPQVRRSLIPIMANHLMLQTMRSCLLATLSSSVALSQTPEVMWESRIPNQVLYTAFDLAPLSNGDALYVERRSSFQALYGGPLVVGRLDQRGAVIAAQQLGSADFFSTARIIDDGTGGAYVLAVIASAGFADPPLAPPGSQDVNDILLVRIDGALNVQWARRFGTVGNDAGNDLVADGSGGVYIVGSVSALGGYGGSPFGDSDGILVRVDSAGNEVFARRRGQTGHNSYLASVERHATNGVWCGATRRPISTPQGATVGSIDRFTDNGTFMSSVNAGSPGGEVTVVVSDGLGGYLYLHKDEFSGSEFVRHNGSGQRLWAISNFASTWGGPQASIERLGNGQFVLCGPTYLRGIDVNAATAWEWTIPWPGGHANSSVVASSGFGTLYYTRSNSTPEQVVIRATTNNIGTAGCPSQANSTGSAAVLAAAGSALRTDDALIVYGSGLPPQTFAYFLCSTTSGFVAMAGGSQGDLCLGGAIGRFLRSGEVWSVGGDGRMHLQLDLDDLPQPTQSVSAVAGSTWHFQGWYRDLNPTATSNFTGSVGVTLL